MPLRVTATSFLLPGSHAWRALAPWRPELGDYGDWPQALAGDGDAPLLWVLFLEDLVPAGETADLAPLLAPLEGRLAAATAPTLVAWSAWRPESAIAGARRATPWQRLGRALEDALEGLAERHRGLHLLPLDRILAPAGLEAAFDARAYYAARCRLSTQGLRLLAEAVAALLTRLERPARKLLVLDADGTLWGGVVGEVGLDGIALGQDGIGTAYADFQRAAQRLAGEGVLLALASKNQPEDVWAVLDRHPGRVLRRDDLAAWRIGWEEKAETVAAIAEELDLGLDSVAVWDDNPLEREKLRAALPAVLTIEPPEEVAQWPRALARLDAFARFAVTDEDRRKTEQYRSRAAFAAARGAAFDQAAFLRGIGLRPEALALEPGGLARAAQLVAKTNQFNLRLARHDVATLGRLAAEAGDLAFLVRLSDRFGDHGIVGLVLARPAAVPGVAFLDSFLMSCRVLGRHLEAWMLASLAARARARGLRWLVAELCLGERNQPARGFLAEHGFAPAVPGSAPAAAAAAFAAGGTLFAADLETLAIPHLDVFSHD